MQSWNDLKSEIKEWIVRSAETPFLSALKNELKECGSVLEVGSGIHSQIGKVPRKFYLEGIDLLPIKKNKKLWIHDAYKKGDIRNLRKYYKNSSFDAVIAIDVIEHLTKKDGFRLLDDMEWIARKKIIILTPEGFHVQGTVDGNPFMEHLSGWSTGEFKKYGYTTHGMHGLKILRGEEASIKYKPWYVWILVSHLTQYITHFFPRIAFHIIAIKSLPKGKENTQDLT